MTVYGIDWKDKNRIRLREDWIVVQKVKDFETPEKIGSIIIPKSVKLSMREAKIGRIVNYGPGLTLNDQTTVIPTEYRIGDLVYYHRYANDKLPSFNVKDQFIMLRSNAILAYIRPLQPNQQLPGPDDVYPRNERLLVEPTYSESYETKSGLYVADDPTKKQVSVLTYKLVRLGPGKICLEDGSHKQMPIKPGETVWTNFLSGAIISLLKNGERKEYRLLSELDVLVHGSEDN